MKTLVILKMIVRSWWRNKVFFFISVLSLAVGLACTNLLFSFFVHDYNIERNNPDKERIYWMQQDNPMDGGKRVDFVSDNIPALLRQRYAGIEACLQVSDHVLQYCRYNGSNYTDVTMLQADSTLLRLFPQEVAIGSLKQVLEQPDKVAVTEAFARRLFGSDNPIGKVVEGKIEWQGTKRYEVAAVIRSHSQGLFRFDMLTGKGAHFFGGTTFLLLAPGTSPAELERQIKADKIPTLLPDSEAQYYLKPLPELYLHRPGGISNTPSSYINHSNLQLLYISLAAALLVLVIACCNYTNMSLSRVLQQLKTLHIEKLMGSRPQEIRLQLFLDAFLTVLLAFLLSLLLINDVLLLFNDLLGARLPISFFFSSQMLPILLLFVLVMAVVPALYISHKLSSRSYSEYRMLYGGRRKQRLVAVLVVVQFVISIGLLFASFVANRQITLTQQEAGRYEHLISIGGVDAKPAAPLKAELLKHTDKGIESISVEGGTNLLYGWVRELPIRRPDGTEIKSKLLMHTADADALNTLRIELLSGCDWQRTPFPILVNESYVKALVPPTVNPVGYRPGEFDGEAKDTLSVIAGVIRDFPINSLEEAVFPLKLRILLPEQMPLSGMLTIRLVPGKRAEALRFIEETWNRMNEGVPFQYEDLHQLFMERSSKVTDMCRMLVAYSAIGLALTCFGLFGIAWYALRQRRREIAIRKVHGARMGHIIWLLNKPFVIQILLAYVLAVPVVYWLLLPWRQQFVYQAPLTPGCFLLPLLIVLLISAATVCVQGWLLNRNNPLEVIKSE